MQWVLDECNVQKKTTLGRSHNIRLQLMQNTVKGRFFELVISSFFWAGPFVNKS